MGSPMQLQKRTFRIIAAVLFALFVIVTLTTGYRTLSAFESIERKFLEKDMALIQSELDGVHRQLVSHATDWGAWDAMYSAVQVPNRRAELDLLLNGTSLRALDIDFLAMVDTKGNFTEGYVVSDLGGEMPLTDTAKRAVETAIEDIRTKESVVTADELPQLIDIDGSVYLFASSSIFRTNWTGTAQGTLLVGVDFSKKLSQLSELLFGSCVFVPESVPFAAPERWNGTVYIHPSEKGKIAFCQRRGAVYGAIPHVIRCTTERDIYDEGRTSMYGTYLWILLCGVVLVVVVLSILSRLVLRRIRRLKDVAELITEELKLSCRSPVEEEDEITDLARAFNVMCDTLEHLLMNIPDSLVLCDLDGRIVLVNKRSTAALGIETDRLEKENVHISTFIRSGCIRFGNTQPVVYHAHLVTERGEEIPVEVLQNVITFGKRTLMLFLARDLRAQKKMEAQIAWRVYFDELTGLPNRSSLLEVVSEMIDGRYAKIKGESGPWTLVLINMDHFKSINAEVGNIVGDRILILINDRIHRHVPTGTGLQVYRSNGDEFALLVQCRNDTERSELHELVEKLRSEICKSYDVENKTIYPSASFAVVHDIAQCDSAASVLEKGTATIRAAKKNGLGNISYYKEDKKEGRADLSVSLLSMRAEIYSGIGNNEFVPYFQPVYSISQRKLAGFETLVRWMHPTRGLLAPGAFVPHAEKIGIIGEIDRCMMLRALEAVGRTEDPVYFTANGSSNLLQKPETGVMIRDFIDESGVDPSRFVIEVTESVLIDNLEDVSATLEELRARGVRIFLDDFGTGYSSLQYIHSLPLDCIKLDMMFIRHVFDSEKDARMLRTIIDMANSLNLDTIAEGVETEEQLLWLEKAGCNKAQGYFFSKPIPWGEAQNLALSRTGHEKRSFSIPLSGTPNRMLRNDLDDERALFGPRPEEDENDEDGRATVSVWDASLYDPDIYKNWPFWNLDEDKPAPGSSIGMEDWEAVKAQLNRKSEARRSKPIIDRQTANSSNEGAKDEGRDD